MSDTDSELQQTVSSEGSEMNGKDSSYRNAPMLSEPRLVVKQRIRGALVPMRRQDE